MNLVRLGLAWLVLVAHSWPLTGTPDLINVGPETLGTSSVAGFFAISGYLITGSRLRLSLRRYAWHRFLRIFPGYWAMLLVVSFALAPLVSLLAGERWTARGAADYVLSNWTTHLTQLAMAGTLGHAPYLPRFWNGSAWTLEYELMCYVVAGLALTMPLLRRSPQLVLAAAVAAQLVNATVNSWGPYWRIGLVAHFGAWFGAGAALRFWNHSVPQSDLLAAGAFASAVAAAHFGELDSVGALPMAYLVLWAGGRFRVHLRADISYGVYIYAFPIQMTLGDLGLPRSPFLMAAATTVLVVPVAVVSWLLVERPALGLKDLTLHRSGSRPARATIPRQAAPGDRADDQVASAATER